MRTLLAKRTDRIQRLSITRHFKDLVKAFLEDRWFCQRPIGFFLMAKKDMLKDRARHTQKRRHLCIELRTSRRNGVTGMRLRLFVVNAQDAL